MPLTSAQHYLSDYDACLAQLQWAVQDLGIRTSLGQLEEWATLILQSLTGRGRCFHGPEHVLKLAQQATDGIATLAALFHDTIYFQVDHGIPAIAKPYLRLDLDWRQRRFQRRSPTLVEASAAPIVALVDGLFGMSEHRWRDAESCNEYLSALLAAHCFKGVLSLGQIAEVVVAIAATVPFCQPVQGLGPSDLLYQRLVEANQQFDLGLSPRGLEAAIHRAVYLANCDLEGFAVEDTAFFLDQTWRLLPEFNPALRNPQGYRPRDYRKALQKMEIFLGQLQPQQIFQQFQSTPAPALHQVWSQRADRNLAIARLYLQTKVVAIGILEALADYQKIDYSMATWLESQAMGGAAWEQRFPAWALSHPLTNALEAKVMELAEEGRLHPCSFDLSKSPLAAFLIRSIGFDRIRQLRERAQLFFEGKISAEAFLKSCEAKVIQTVTQTLPPFVSQRPRVGVEARHPVGH